MKWPRTWLTIPVISLEIGLTNTYLRTRDPRTGKQLTYAKHDKNLRATWWAGAYSNLITREVC